jgi:hypothetical protein
MGYVVTAPYITVRAKDDLGSDVLVGFYQGGVLPEGVNEDDLDKHVRKGMVAEQGTPEADAATPFGDRVQFDDNSNPMTPQQVADRDKARAERTATKADAPKPAPRPAARTAKD